MGLRRVRGREHGAVLDAHHRQTTFTCIHARNLGGRPWRSDRLGDRVDPKARRTHLKIPRGALAVLVLPDIGDVLLRFRSARRVNQQRWCREKLPTSATKSALTLTADVNLSATG